ncbi:uncharacterized protein [Gorilla gorilla gorilla]|uniref:uncharacterized protein n=1 Tax=Gorilla gorilla gorilla TaxID=9595 RepID=UPI00300B3A05
MSSTWERRRRFAPELGSLAHSSSCSGETAGSTEVCTHRLACSLGSLKPARPCSPEQQSHSRQRELTRVARRSGAQAAEAAAAQLFPGDSEDSCRWGTPPATHLEPAAAPRSLALMDRLISQRDGPEPGMAVPAGRGKTKKVVHPLGGRGCLSLS